MLRNVDRFADYVYIQPYEPDLQLDDYLIPEVKKKCKSYKKFLNTIETDNECRKAYDSLKNELNVRYVAQKYNSSIPLGCYVERKKNNYNIFYNNSEYNKDTWKANKYTICRVDRPEPPKDIDRSIFNVSDEKPYTVKLDELRDPYRCGHLNIEYTDIGNELKNYYN